jgi:hypothetical protein
MKHKDLSAEISTFWTGYCPECSLKELSSRMRLNRHDFYECEVCNLQIVLSAPNVLATILNFRGKSNFRIKPEYADQRLCVEFLCRQTMEEYPFTNRDIFKDCDEIREYLSGVTH